MGDLRSLIQASLDNNGQLSCEVAHSIAGAQGASPQSVRKQVDDLGIRISRCQLGLFGYAKEKGMPGFRAAREAVRGAAPGAVGKMAPIPEEVAAAVREACSDDEITCADLWKIGHDHNVSRFEIGCIAETLELSVKRCQLGCF